MLSNRLSYFYDFRAFLTIDTACSSSLVAFHYAVRDGVMEQRTRSGWWSKCHAQSFHKHNDVQRRLFVARLTVKNLDVDANGYARGEAGVVLLKPLTDAMKDGDKIYATVRGTGVNQDGRTAGISQPSETAQIRLIKTIMQENDIPRENVVLVEAHGTGTAIGDPTEISALAAALGKMPSGQPDTFRLLKEISVIKRQARNCCVIRAALPIKGFCPSTG